jgi:ribulose-phosphate 3-epimerase
MKPMTILPGILAHTPEAYVGIIQRYREAGVTMAHLDIMDGQFVPTITLQPFEILSIPGALPSEAHIMTYHPERFFPDLLALGVRRVVLHVESYETREEVRRMLAEAADVFHEVVITLNPQTSLERLEGLQFAAVQVMAVTPGASGQEQVPGSLERVSHIAARWPGMPISVDGGVGPENILNYATAGACRVVMTSKLAGIENLAQYIHDLEQVVATHL